MNTVEEKIVSINEFCAISGHKLSKVRRRISSNRSLFPNHASIRIFAMSNGTPRKIRVYKLSELIEFMKETDDRMSFLRDPFALKNSNFDISELEKDYIDPIFNGSFLPNSSEYLMNSLGCYR